MSRIFASMAVVAVTLIAIVMFLGLRIGDYNGPYGKLIESKRLLIELHGDESEAAQAKFKTIDASIDGIYDEMKPMRERTSLHKIFAILAALVVVLVNSIAVTYFIGTSRWCKEVVAAYKMENEFINRSNRIKRRCFPWSFLGIITVLGIIALGAASDPATAKLNTMDWVTPHLWASMIGMGVIAYSFMNQFSKIQSHTELVEEITAEVRRIRIERNLEVDD